MLYNIMFYGGLVLFILFLIATVVIFFVMKIPKAFGVVTGKTQKKAIEEIKSGTVIPTGRRSRTKGSAILARDVGGKVLDKSGSIFKGSRTDKRSSDASEKLAEKAIEDAKNKAQQQAKEAEEKAAKAREEDDTELLKYSETKKKKKNATGEEATDVLEEEKPTDVLSDEEEAEEIKTVGQRMSKEEDDEDSTDVLEKAKNSDYNEEEDVTDVLRTMAVSADIIASEEEESKTAVLTSDMGSTLSENEIYGVYNPEMTAVLRSDMAPGEDSIRANRSNINLDGIKVLYSETIVHTNESL